MSIHPGIVYVIDDDEAFRDSVAWLLQTHGYQARLFPNAEAFLLEVKPGVGGPPRCAVLDVRMPGMSGPQAQEALAERGIKIPLIFVTAHADVPIAVTAIKRGAFDFIEKPFAEGDLLKRVEEALSFAVEAQAQHSQMSGITARLASLSERERQVLDAVVSGKMNKTIAYDLDISIKTVEAHRARVMEKMEATSLAHLIRMVAMTGL
ncbi:MAG TPA: response regulator [Casimicrobium sp.]|jgi:two-component system response regulator TtrR|nr:response regulator [Casimicrobium sp.]HPG61987.1 response regulator [Casimicrobium sp.]HPT58127.1 response regulator [Casimicrobium sp.]